VSAPSTAYRRLALGTVAATFLLIVLGGIVRVSDSGLGCGKAHSGLHGWPLCRGDVLPGVNLHTWIEYAHRFVASAVVVLMFVLAIQAWRRYRAHRGIRWAASAGSALIVAQALLGAATVEHDLNETLVSAHLGLAMLLFALTIYIWRSSRPEVIGAQPADGGVWMRRLSVVGMVLVLCTIVAGGYMAGTEHFGRSDAGVEVNIHLVHRSFLYLATIVLLALVFMAWRRRPSPRVTRLAWVIGGVLVLQILVGALNVWIAKEYEALIVTHLALATVLWGAVTAMTLQFVRVPAPAPELGRSHAEAVPA
jgi:heme A synthase